MTSERRTRDRTRIVMAIVVSLTVLGVSLYVILNPSYSEAHWDWAFGTVGLVLGYWLK